MTELSDIPTDRDRWHGLSWLIGLFSATGRIVGSRPESLLIVGPPAAGKTANVNRFRFPEDATKNSHMVFMTNASSWGLSVILKERVPRGVTHVVAPEMQSLMLRKGAVWDSIVSFLLPALEEGVHDIYNGPQKKSYGGAKFGLIACIATDAYNKRVGELADSGLLDRMMTVRFSRDPHNFILSRYAFNAGDTSELEKIDTKLPARIDVHLSRRVADTITDYTTDIFPSATHRDINRFVALCKAVAYYAGEAEVSESHLQALRTVEGFWSSH